MHFLSLGPLSLCSHWVASLTLSLTMLLLWGCNFQANALASDPGETTPTGQATSSRALITHRDSKLITRIRVRAQIASQRNIAADANVTGVVMAFRKSVVAAEVGGSVVRRFIEPGAHVASGQVLIELDRQRSQIAFDRASAEQQTSQVDYARAEHELLRGRRLIETNVISQDTLDDLRFSLDRAYSVRTAAKANRDDAARTLDNSKIRAPFSGTTEFVHVQTGDYLVAGTPVVTLADFSKVRIVAGITASAAASLKIGNETKIVLDSSGKHGITATIKSVGRIADANGTFPLEVWVSGPAASSLREGMVATVQLPQAEDLPVVSVPRSALLRKEGQMYVYILGPSPTEESGYNLATLRAVNVGRSDANFTQIIEGITSGERVIIDGLFALRDGAPVELLN